MKNARRLPIGTVVSHFKRDEKLRKQPSNAGIGLYKIIGYGRGANDSTNTPVVFYVSLYDDADTGISFGDGFYRDEDEFYSLTDRDKYPDEEKYPQEYRFEEFKYQGEEERRRSYYDGI